MRDQADETPQLEDTEQDLEGPPEHHHGKGNGCALGGVIRVEARVMGEDDGHDHGHRSGGAGYLGRGAAKQRREQADEDGAVDTGDGAGAGSDAHAHGQGQGDHGGGQSAVDVALDVVEMQAVDQTFHGFSCE